MKRLTEWFYKPYAKMMQDFPEMADGQPFECVYLVFDAYFLSMTMVL